MTMMRASLKAIYLSTMVRASLKTIYIRFHHFFRSSDDRTHALRYELWSSTSLCLCWLCFIRLWARWQVIYPSILYWEVDCACDVSILYDQAQIGVEVRGSRSLW